MAELMPARQELAELVAIPSVADPRLFPLEECRRAAEWVAGRFTGLGFADVRLMETPDGSSVVIGTRPCRVPDAPTVLLYEHYDVQPPLDEAAWRTPPFCLAEVDGRWQFLFWSFTWPLWLCTLVVAVLGSIVWIGLGALRRHRRRKARREARY